MEFSWVERNSNLLKKRPTNGSVVHIFSDLFAPCFGHLIQQSLYSIKHPDDGRMRRPKHVGAIK
jgi:hypothetical protein